jgi:alkanesulfonate monooxygenase SsuD/methylene tetrahydromethanopterin reductase-like flavin-dependent oxidoreductase (luciferase family)
MRPVRYGLQLRDSEPVPKVIALVQLAEELGYHSVWLQDSELLSPELYTKLAACALNTRRITVAAGVTHTRTRYPTVTASGLATLADLAPGRIAASIGRGGSAHQLLGWKAVKLADFRRDFDLIARLLRGESVRSNGHELKLAWLDRARAPEIPLYVSLGYGPRSQRVAGEMGYPVGLNVELHHLPGALAAIDAGAAAAGRAVREMGVSWWNQIAIFEDWQAIKEHMLGTLLLRVRTSYRNYRQGTLAAEDLPVDLELARRIVEEASETAHGRALGGRARWLLDYPDDRWRQWLKGYLVGTPDQVAARLREGLQHDAIFEVVVNPYVSSERLSVEGLIETFARRVRPLVSGE